MLLDLLAQVVTIRRYRLKKILSTKENILSTNTIETSVERVSGLSPKDFYANFVFQEKPVILTDMIDSWPAKELWSPDYFKSKYGDVQVLVQFFENGSLSSSNDSISRQHKNMGLAEFINLKESNETGGRYYLCQNPITKLIPELKKDIRDIPYFTDFIHKHRGWKESFWVGPGGSTTPLHFDSLENMFIHFWGKKKWILYPKTQLADLYMPSDLPKRNFSPIDLMNPDLEKFPKFKNTRAYEVIVSAGETLYVPNRWAHYVEALDFSIGMNYLWSTWRREFKYLIDDILVRSPSQIFNRFKRQGGKGL